MLYLALYCQEVVMIETLSIGTAKALLAACRGGSTKLRIVIVLSLTLLGSGMLLYVTSEILPFEDRVLRSAGFGIGGLGLVIGFLITSLQKGREEVVRDTQLEAVPK